MKAAPMPEDESARLASLVALDVLDSAPEEEFDSLVRAAALACGKPISLISLVDASRQWFKANVGLPGVQETPREVSFCTHAIGDDEMFEVPDATTDPRFAANPLVTGNPNIRFYAGIPLRLADGARVGTLCVIDRAPGRLTKQQREILRQLGIAAVHALEAREALRGRRVVAARFEALSASAPLGVFATDPSGNCIYTNALWQKIYGMSRASSLGRGWSRTIHPEDKSAIFDEWKRCAQLAIPVDLNFRLLHDDGRVVHVRSISNPVFDENGEISGHVGSVEDVTERLRQSEEIKAARDRLELATESGGIGVWEFNVETEELVWDSTMCRLYGRPEEAATGKYDMWARYLHPEDRAAAEQSIRESMVREHDFDTEFRIVWDDGSVRYLRATARIARDSSGRALKMVGVNWDVTRLRTLTAELAEQHELLHVTLQSIGDAVITTNAQSEVSWLNPAAERMTGWSVADACGVPLMQVFNIVCGDTRAPAQNPASACMTRGTPVGLAQQTVLISRNGSEFGIEESAAPIRSGTGETLGAVLVFHDVTEQRRISGELSHRAKHDAMTGLVNRAEFESRLGRTLNKAREDSSEHALLYIDLDQFKLVNDACGHAAGDQLLRQVSKMLTGVVRSRDTLARVGGDEFAVIMEYCTADQALRLAEIVCSSMDAYRFVHEGRSFRVGASVGLVPLDARWQSPAKALQAADASCYAAKEGGRNRVHKWCSADMAVETQHGEMRWASRLEQALDEDRFRLYAQRIDATDGTSCTLDAEILIRLVGSAGEIVAAGAFLPAAERFHLATRIDHWVLRAVVDRLLALDRIQSVGTLFVNLSGLSIGDRAFHESALQVLTEAGRDVCQRICLEVTETATITNILDAAAFIKNARALGVRVALDDFGAGASSFGYLKTLTVDMLKIDGQFIKNVNKDALDDAAVRCFVDVAQVIGVKTVAECVEQPDVLQRVRELGVDFAQGFLLHRPEPLESLVTSQPFLN